MVSKNWIFSLLSAWKLAEYYCHGVLRKREGRFVGMRDFIFLKKKKEEKK